ncbi:threonine dehydratase [Mumia sp. ZJ1417]|uniref:threonine dehydratase n=1 Tax=Mumia sp. ZJ1417 TaxID=2708082 RepID=UPI001422D4F8|nr:threonine dehydratase [Mumia sp. ZJ1417]QMW68123.1 threonine dehydratase [Mumia sp. ZJ1417]
MSTSTDTVPTATGLPDHADLLDATRAVRAAFAPTPQQVWPLLSEELGATVWAKHENHTPLGAFKARSALVYFDRLARSGALPTGVVSATRGNHGQALAYAAGRRSIPATVVVPRGNSREKNAAMQALGAELIEHGADFQDSLEHARALATKRGIALAPNFHPWLVAGAGTYALEYLSAVPDLDVVYVPIGLGSGACGMLAAKAALGHRAEVVGVVSAGARAYADSLEAGALVSTPVTTRLADGMACRTPVAEALALIRDGISRVVVVSDDEVSDAMRLLYRTTHNVAEGAGAAATAAATQERDRNAGHIVGVVVTGGNVDTDVYAAQLARQP